MNVLDSSAWIEFLRGGPLAPTFLPIIEDRPNLIVPIISVYEVYKWTLLEKGEHGVETARRLLSNGRIWSLNESLCDSAAKLSIQHKLPMADAIIYATAMANDADVWTTDGHFKGLPNVKYFEKS